MNSNTMKHTFYYTSSTPSSSRPAATNRPQSESVGSFSKLSRGGERGWGWHAHNEGRATANHQAHPNIQGNVQRSDLRTPIEPKAAGTSYPGSLISPTHKAFPPSPRRMTGKRTAYDSEVGEVIPPNKRPRREDTGHTHAVVGLTSGSSCSSQPESHWNALATTADTMGQHFFGAGICGGTSAVKRDTVIMEAPKPSTADPSNAAQSTQHGGGDKHDFQAFLNMILEEFKAKSESPNTSGDFRQTEKCDALKKERRKYLAPAAASYRWSDLYNGPKCANARKGPPPARTAWEDTAPHDGTGTEDAGIEPFPLATLGDISLETVAGPSSLALALAAPVDAPATGSTQGAPFQYTPEVEAEIWSAAAQANYPKARSLFHPSECPRIIEGDELKRFVTEHPDRVRMAGRMATKLWVCQATAKWAADGTVTYTPEACRTTSTSKDICMRHINTVHLGKGREKRATQ